jgi:hypothetical protein
VDMDEDIVVMEEEHPLILIVVRWDTFQYFVPNHALYVCIVIVESIPLNIPPTC